MLRFDAFTFRHDPPELRRDGEPVHLRPQAVELLEILLEEPGRLVTHEAIRERIWGDTVVEYEQGTHALVRELRAVLGDDATSPRYVATVARRGYRFVAPVEGMEEAEEAAGAEEAEHLAGAEDVAGAGEAADDSPAARRRWLVGIGAILLAMILVPGALYRLGAPDPPAVALAPPSAAAPAALGTLAERVSAGLDASPRLTLVPWNLGRPEGADLVLELGAFGEEGAGPAVTVGLHRWPERTRVWEQRIRAEDPGALAGAVVTAVEGALAPR